MATWTEYTWDGTDGWLWEGKLFISADYNPETGVAIAFFAPPGGRAAVPAMVKGDPGVPFTPGTVNPTVLDWDDPTADSAEWELVTPGDDDTPAVYDFNWTYHAPEPGTGGTPSLLDADDLVGSPAAGYTIIYSATAGPGSTPAGVWTAPKVGGVYWPASIASTTSADGAQRTLTSVSIPAQPFDWRPEAFATCVFTGTGADCAADLMARVNTAASGDIVSRKAGLALTTPRDLTMIPGPAAGSATTLGKISSGAGPTTVYLRAERQTGADSFSTSSSTTSFYVKVAPLP